MTIKGREDANGSRCLPFAPDEMVSASDLKDFIFCQRSWFLNRQGFDVAERSMEERHAGIAFHEARAGEAEKGSNPRTLWWAVSLVLLGVALLLVNAFLTARS